MIDLQDVKVKNTEDWDSICPFPVGFVYMSTSKTSPATTYGGQWSGLTDSRFPRFVATTVAVLAKGGSTTHRHLTTIGKARGEQYFYINDGDVNIAGTWTDPTYGCQYNAQFAPMALVSSSGTSGNRLDMNQIPGYSIIQNTPSRFNSTGGTNSTPPLRQPVCVVQNCVKISGRW